MEKKMMLFAYKILINKNGPENLKSDINIIYKDKFEQPSPINNNHQHKITNSPNNTNDHNNENQPTYLCLRTRNVVFQPQTNKFHRNTFRYFFTKLVNYMPNIFLLGYNDFLEKIDSHIFAFNTNFCNFFPKLSLKYHFFYSNNRNQSLSNFKAVKTSNN